MPEKDPTSYSILTYGWVLLLSLWGGATNYISKVRAGECGRLNLTELIGDLVTSGFSGVLTFYLCEGAQLQPLMTAALVGISGHMGSRAIYKAERLLTRWVGAKETVR